MKQGTPELMKFKRLQRRLGLDKQRLCGLLELLWLTTAANTHRGDIGRLTNEDIAEAVGWDILDADRLVKELIAEGWLDAHPEHRLIVHDWSVHAPGYIHQRIHRVKPEGSGTFADGFHAYERTRRRGGQEVEDVQDSVPQQGTATQPRNNSVATASDSVGTAKSLPSQAKPSLVHSIPAQPRRLSPDVSAAPAGDDGDGDGPGVPPAGPGGGRSESQLRGQGELPLAAQEGSYDPDASLRRTLEQAGCPVESDSPVPGRLLSLAARCAIHPSLLELWILRTVEQRSRSSTPVRNAGFFFSITEDEIRAGAADILRADGSPPGHLAPLVSIECNRCHGALVQFRDCVISACSCSTARGQPVRRGMQRAGSCFMGRRANPIFASLAFGKVGVR